MRKRPIAALKHDAPERFALFVDDKRQFEAQNEFARASGRFDLTARGKVNTYALFAELFATLARARAGAILPTGMRPMPPPPPSSPIWSKAGGWRGWWTSRTARGFSRRWTAA